jgi:hypothetical protein
MLNAILLICLITGFNESCFGQINTWSKLDSSNFTEYFRYQNSELLSSFNYLVNTKKVKAYTSITGSTIIGADALAGKLQKSGVLFSPFQGLYKPRFSNTLLYDNVLLIHLVDSLFSDQSRIGFAIDEYTAKDSIFLERKVLYYINCNEVKRYLTSDECFVLSNSLNYLKLSQNKTTEVSFTHNRIIKVADSLFESIKTKIFLSAIAQVPLYVLPGASLNDSFTEISKEGIENKIAKLLNSSSVQISKSKSYLIKNLIEGIGVLLIWNFNGQVYNYSQRAISTSFRITPYITEPLFYIKRSDIHRVLTEEELIWIRLIEMYYITRRIDEWGGYGRPYVKP